MTGVDPSAKTLELARKRLCESAALQQADLNDNGTGHCRRSPVLFIEAGFRITVVSEPPPAPGAHERFPDEVKTPESAYLCFLFLVLEAP